MFWACTQMMERALLRCVEWLQVQGTQRRRQRKSLHGKEGHYKHTHWSRNGLTFSTHTCLLIKWLTFLIRLDALVLHFFFQKCQQKATCKWSTEPQANKLLVHQWASLQLQLKNHRHWSDLLFDHFLKCRQKDTWKFHRPKTQKQLYSNHPQHHYSLIQVVHH